ncbi:MAG: snoRNA-binding protein [Chaenotheca gracillima]|nr:MAG: snoRNA-binding protein [Chaenotheca gracillima]
MDSFIKSVMSKQREVVFFSSTAIALYGYDQGMMSLINTNYDYLDRMGLAGDSPMVGVIVSVYYLGCAVGAVVASWYADWKGRKLSIFACLLTASLGNLFMFIAGIDNTRGARTLMLVGRVVMGLGVGGIDSVVPVYSSELSADEARGKALAQEFQMNIFGLLMAFLINLGVTIALGKENQWAWRIPIIIMQVYPLIMFSVAQRLPETPRWFISHGRKKDAHAALLEMLGGEEPAKAKLEELVDAHDEESSQSIGYKDMLLPNGSQFHPTVVTIMGQVNQALTGYGAVSVYGPQIFELLGFGVRLSEYLTLGNYISYFFMMTFAWLLIDKVGRRPLMIWGAFGIAICFALLTAFGGLAMNADRLGIVRLGVAVPGIVTLFVATATFGIGWLAEPWLIPTEIYPSSARAQGAAVSVIIWGLANFAVTLLTPIGFNNLKYLLFLVFAVTNSFAAWWTWAYSPESGGRSFEENQDFFKHAESEKTWMVRKIQGGAYKRMPDQGKQGDESGEREPLLSSS